MMANSKRFTSEKALETITASEEEKSERMMKYFTFDWTITNVCQAKELNNIFFVQKRFTIFVWGVIFSNKWQKIL